MHILTPMVRYVVLYLALILCVCNFSRSLMYSQVTQRQVIKVGYTTSILFTLEIHCIIRVKHVLTHHSSTANSPAELTYHYWMLLHYCGCYLAHTNALIALPSNLLIPHTVSILTPTIMDIGRTQLVTMHVDTGDSPPICQKPYTLPLKHYS